MVQISSLNACVDSNTWATPSWALLSLTSSSKPTLTYGSVLPRFVPSLRASHRIAPIPCCIENPCPYCWQHHTCRDFSPIPVAGTTQVAPRPDHHPEGQQQHTRQVHPFPARHATPITSPPQPTSSRSVFSNVSSGPLLTTCPVLRGRALS